MWSLFFVLFDFCLSKMSSLYSFFGSHFLLVLSGNMILFTSEVTGKKKFMKDMKSIWSVFDIATFKNRELLINLWESYCKILQDRIVSAIYQTSSKNGHQQSETMVLRMIIYDIAPRSCTIRQETVTDLNVWFSDQG